MLLVWLAIAINTIFVQLTQESAQNISLHLYQATPHWEEYCSFLFCFPFIQIGTKKNQQHTQMAMIFLATSFRGLWFMAYKRNKIGGDEDTCLRIAWFTATSLSLLEFVAI